MSRTILQEVKTYLLIALGILSAAFGIKGFLIPGGLIDGGVTGISMLLHYTLNWPVALLLALINAPFIILGFHQLGKKFAFKSIIAIAAFAVCVALFPEQQITSEKLLTPVFGGFFLGLGIGLAIRGGAVLDGTEITALLISRNISYLRVSDVILIWNVIIFLSALFFLGSDRTMYSILTYFAASKTIDYFLYGLDEYTGVTIVSENNDKIRKKIVDELKRGVTVYSSKGGYGKRGEKKQDNEILFIVVTRLEVGKLRSVIHSIDEEAFIIENSINDVHGGMMSRRRMH
jgi:uncharacterized membrane-anchored protein YitT (DUF2179 family)